MAPRPRNARPRGGRRRRARAVRRPGAGPRRARGGGRVPAARRRADGRPRRADGARAGRGRRRASRRARSTRRTALLATAEAGAPEGLPHARADCCAATSPSLRATGTTLPRCFSRLHDSSRPSISSSRGRATSTPRARRSSRRLPRTGGPPGGFAARSKTLASMATHVPRNCCSTDSRRSSPTDAFSPSGAPAERGRTPPRPPAEDVLRWGWIATMAPSIVLWDADAGTRSTSARRRTRDAGALAGCPSTSRPCAILVAWNGDLAAAASAIAEADAVTEATGSRLPPFARCCSPRCAGTRPKPPR